MDNQSNQYTDDLKMSTRKEFEIEDVNQQSQENQQSSQYQKKRGNEFGFAAMVVVIVAIVETLMYYLQLGFYSTFVFGVITLGLAIGGLIMSRDGRPKGTSIIGLVLAIIVIVICIVMFVDYSTKIF